MKTCTKCGLSKPLSEFPPVRRGEPKLQTWCRDCFAKANAANYAKHREREKARLLAQTSARRDNVRREIVAYLAGHPCVDCGESDIVVLEFDHRGEKIANVSTYANSGRTWPRIRVEIIKCDVRCANCHRRRTAERAAAKRQGVTRSSRRRPVQLEIESALTTRRCRVCGRERPLSEFPFRSIGAGTQHWICIECQRTSSRIWYQRTVGRPVRLGATRWIDPSGACAIRLQLSGVTALR